MKKITLSVALLLGGVAAKAQTEYIDITTKNLFGRSEMVLYNDIAGYNDLEYFYLGRFNKKRHWVRYTYADKVVISFLDKLGDTRELCTQEDDKPQKCAVVNTNQTVFTFKPKGKVFEVLITKPL
tara:strand:- start:146 stop:520 length:375 start_codon:yes stop_codon:yes gene_type:complete